MGPPMFEKQRPCDVFGFANGVLRTEKLQCECLFWFAATRACKVHACAGEPACLCSAQRKPSVSDKDTTTTTTITTVRLCKPLLVGQLCMFRKVPPCTCKTDASQRPACGAFKTNPVKREMCPPCEARRVRQFAQSWCCLLPRRCHKHANGWGLVP